MLSRHADSCFWIGRHVERAEACARAIDVHYHAALESFIPYTLVDGSVRSQPGNSASLGWQPILAISGSAGAYRERYGVEDDRNVLQFFIFDLDNPGSILSTWTAARENARAIRGLIASEMWESMNVSYLALQEWNVDRILGGSPHEFFELVKNASHLFQGILNRTMMMGETRDWLDVGRFLERGSQTGRLLDVKYHILLPAWWRGDHEENEAETSHAGQAGGSLPGNPDAFGIGGPLDTHGWTAVLKSVSAFEMHRKRYSEGITPANVVDFLLLDPHFPASMRHCIERVGGCLRRIADAHGEDTPGEPVRLVGRLSADLTYSHPEEIITDGLHEFLYGVERRYSAIGESITRAYLSY